MLPLIAGTLAAISAWAINSFMVRRWGDAAISVLVPVAEEMLKTFLAVAFSTSILFTHITFGIIEAVWDIKANIRGLNPGIIALVTHGFFGLVTWAVLSLTGILALAIMTSIVTHIIWNSIIINNSHKNK